MLVLVCWSSVPESCSSHSILFSFPLILLRFPPAGLTGAKTSLPGHMGKGCHTRCQLHIRSKFGVQFSSVSCSRILRHVAQFSSAPGKAGTRTSDLPIISPTALLSYHHPILFNQHLDLPHLSAGWLILLYFNKSMLNI